MSTKDLTAGAKRVAGVVVVAVIWGTVAVLALNAGRLLEERRSLKGLPAAPVTPTAYTVILQGTINSPSGPSAGSVQTFAVRSDGSSMQRTELLEGPGPRQISERIVHLSTGLRVMIDELREVRSSTAEDGGPRLRDSRSNCINSYGGRPMSQQERFVGEEEISGMRTVRVVSGDVTSWYAPEAGCARVRMVRGNYELSLVSLVTEEPPQEFFQIPSFTEAPPSEYFRLPGESTDARERDSRYFKRRPRNSR